MDIKHEVDERLTKMTTLRDEIRVQLHLASLDAKREWSERLEPKVLEAEGVAKQASEATKAALEEVVGRLEAFARKLRGS